MPYTWIQNQPDAVVHWVNSTSCPMLVSTDDGGILWVNQSLERLLGWSAVELVGHGQNKGKKWTELTVETEDLAHDRELLRGVVVGERNEYYLHKQYRSKSGEAIHVMIHVLRWPTQGEIKCYLVTVSPLNRGSEYLVGEISALKTMISKTLLAPKETIIEKHLNWADRNKVMAGMLYLFAAYLLFGERVISAAREIKSLFLKP